MKKEVESIIAKALIAVLLLLAVRAVIIISSSRKKGNELAKQKMLGLTKGTAGKDNILSGKDRVLAYAAQLRWRSDPFGTSSVGAAAPVASMPKANNAALKLKGIFLGEQGNVAIIDDALVREGQIINGAKVIKINPDSVVIGQDGSERKLFLSK